MAKNKFNWHFWFSRRLKQLSRGNHQYLLGVLFGASEWPANSSWKNHFFPKCRNKNKIRRYCVCEYQANSSAEKNTETLLYVLVYFNGPSFTRLLLKFRKVNRLKSIGLQVAGHATGLLKKNDIFSTWVRLQGLSRYTVFCVRWGGHLGIFTCLSAPRIRVGTYAYFYLLVPL